MNEDISAAQSITQASDTKRSGFLRNTLTVIALVAGLVLSVVAASGSVEAKELTSVFGTSAADSKTTVDHSVWDGLLKAYVVAGGDGLNRVNYKAFKANGQKALKGYVAALQKVDPRNLGKKEQFAYWANLYNAKTIDVVLDNYPVKSIRKISLSGGLFGSLASSVGAGGPWKTKIMKVTGVELSLDDIEHGILRPIFKDPRVHYAVNCASVGCPNLSRDALTAENLDSLLDAGARAYINSPRGFVVQGGKLEASSIYNWFKVDFGGSDAGVIAHARQYAEPGLKDKLGKAGKISGYDYDWSLNDTN